MFISQHAYVDEAGDPHLSLEKAGTSEFYVVCAVLVDENNAPHLARRLDEVRGEHFGPSEMKSSGVGGNTQRRGKLIISIVNAGVKFYAIIVDKKKIDKDSGLQWKTSFIKYLHGRLYKRLYRAFSNLRVYADAHGSPEFMDSFKKYLEGRYQGHLFEKQIFAMVKSEDEVAVQAADIIAGTLLRVYSGKDSKELVAALTPATILIERWPPDASMPDVVSGIPDEEKYDHLVAEQGVMLARQHITSNADTNDPDAESRVEALRYLLYRYELDPSVYVEAKTVLDHVNLTREEVYSLQAFRSNVIGRLRSEGVIIASSNQGCKIPNSASDMHEYVSLVDGQAVPYLERLAVARNHLKFITTGEYDIVDSNKFPKLRKCLDALG